MKYSILGNYYENKFHLPPTTGTEATEIFIKKFSPADTTELLWNCPINYKDVEKVVMSAQHGFESFSKINFTDRKSLIKRYQEEIHANKDELATAIALETGKPLTKSIEEVEKTITSIDIILAYAEKKLTPTSTTYDGYSSNITFRPIGPILIITPFDYPCQIPSGRIVSALIGGNSIIVKPSEKATYVTQILINCLHSAGFPLGVINFIAGDSEIGKRLVKYREIAGILFVGSKETGSYINEVTKNQITKMVSLELSGKNSTIIHNDVVIDNVIDHIVDSCYSNSGQNCLSTSIIALHKDIEDEFISKFHAKSKKIVIDHPIDFEEQPFMGPLIDKQAEETYLLFIGMAKREGIKEIMRGKKLNKKHNGYYVSPSIHYSDHFDPKSMFLGSEILSPNCTIIPYTTIEEAISIANNTEFGLATSVFTNSDDIYNKCLEAVDSAIINLNLPTTHSIQNLPVCGRNSSGNFRIGGTRVLDSCILPVSGVRPT